MPSTDTLLRRFIDTYWGYGRLDAPWWFVGMEEGGGDTWETILEHLRTWHIHGEASAAPLRRDDPAIAASRWFGSRPRIQPYWGKRIRMRLAADGRRCDTEAVRAYQAADLAAPHGDTCLLELLPLPSPSTGTWVYGEHSMLPALRDRATYLAEVTPRRVDRLRGMIAEYRPQVVVSAGRSYAPHWDAAAGMRLPAWPEPPAISTVSGGRMLILTHPTAHGVTNMEFEQAGRALATTPRTA